MRVARRQVAQEEQPTISVPAIHSALSVTVATFSYSILSFGLTKRRFRAGIALLCMWSPTGHIPVMKGWPHQSHAIHDPKSYTRQQFHVIAIIMIGSFAINPVRTQYCKRAVCQPNVACFPRLRPSCRNRDTSQPHLLPTLPLEPIIL
jgi:hypothetical protein